MRSFQRGDFAGAIAKVDEVRAMRARVFGEDSLPVARSTANLAAIRQRQGDLAAAESAYAFAAERFRHHLGDHPDLALVLHGQAGNFLKQGRLPEAEESARQALAIRLAAFPPAADAVIDTRIRLAQILEAAGRLQEADGVLHEAERAGPAGAKAVQVAEARRALGAKISKRD